VQMGQFESSPYLPTLGALDAEFGCEDEQCAAARRREGGAAMSAKFSSTQSEFPTQLGTARPMTETRQETTASSIVVRPSLAKRASLGLARFLVVFCIGVAATLAWQLYGDAARATIANSSPQLGWLAPQTAPVVPTAHDVVAPAAAASPELQQLTVGLAFVRQSIDQLAARFATNQRQMADDIAKLQTNEQEILHKLSATPPRPAAAPARKPDPVTPSPSAQAR
jgi:hypothetical protein